MNKEQAQNQVNRKLNAMVKGDILEVKDYAPNHPALFIELAKKYIDQFGNIEFNQAYTRLRKL